MAVQRKLKRTGSWVDHLKISDDHLVNLKLFLEQYFLSDKDLNLGLDISYLSYKEKYEEAIRRSTIIYKKLQQLHDEMGGSQEAFMYVTKCRSVV